MIESVGLFLAGLIGGMVNSIAGGGSFITFPALMAATPRARAVSSMSIITLNAPLGLKEPPNWNNSSLRWRSKERRTQALRRWR